MKVNGFRVELVEIERKAEEKLSENGERAFVAAKREGLGVELRGFLYLKQADEQKQTTRDVVKQYVEDSLPRHGRVEHESGCFRHMCHPRIL